MEGIRSNMLYTCMKISKTKHKYLKKKKKVRRETLEIGLNMFDIHGTHVSNSQRINKNNE